MVGVPPPDRDREGRASVRRIEPHGLLINAPVWYILARDVDKGGGDLVLLGIPSRGVPLDASLVVREARVAVHLNPFI